MNAELLDFAARLRSLISSRERIPRIPDFDKLALELFALQCNSNLAYRKICAARGATPRTIAHWTQVPAVPTAAFKELELSSLASVERTAVFHSSGTTEQRPSRHFHNNKSLMIYEASLWTWFRYHFGDVGRMLFLTPDADAAPCSSLVHMFETIRQKFGLPRSAFTGNVSADGSWAVNFIATEQKLKEACDSGTPLTLLGTAFSFVHLLDHLNEKDLRFHLPKDSRVMETGGYKNRSRVLPKAELHKLISDRLSVPGDNIVCEYGMSELSSQAYDAGIHPHVFHFPPWARAQIISPETGREVADGETGIIRIFDLANVFSVAAIQTEDLGIRCGDGFELIGRGQMAEPRGCSLMTA